jgi:hypothetical protein
MDAEGGCELLHGHTASVGGDQGLYLMGLEAPLRLADDPAAPSSIVPRLAWRWRAIGVLVREAAQSIARV